MNINNFIGDENRCSFANAYGVDFRVWKHHRNYFSLCFDGFKQGQNICPVIKDDLNSVEECFTVANTIKNF